jgi:hypothetical protein
MNLRDEYYVSIMNIYYIQNKHLLLGHELLYQTAKLLLTLTKL